MGHFFFSTQGELLPSNAVRIFSSPFRQTDRRVSCYTFFSEINYSSTLYKLIVSPIRELFNDLVVVLAKNT